MSTHSPFPWKSKGHSRWIYDAKDRLIAIIYASEDAVLNVAPKEDQIGNAAIIAAAPEMLATLKLFTERDGEPCRFDHHGMCQEHLIYTDKGACAVQAAWDLIAKAEATP